MRHVLLATAFALACAAAAAAAQSGRVKRSEPAAQPPPEQRDALLLPPAARDGEKPGAKLASKRGGDAADAEPERDEAGDRVYFGRQVDRKARLLSRPEPVYPRRARRSGVEGTVVLRVVLAATGRVERVTVVKGLPEGLTEEAIKAARAIKFEPAERDGRRVSQSVVIEYNFNVY